MADAGSWRDRLRAAVQHDGRKQAAIAWQAGIALESLNRILNGHTHPRFDTLVRIAEAVNVSVGWLLREDGYDFSPGERARLVDAARIILARERSIIRK